MMGFTDSAVAIGGEAAKGYFLDLCDRTQELAKSASALAEGKEEKALLGNMERSHALLSATAASVASLELMSIVYEHMVKLSGKELADNWVKNIICENLENALRSAGFDGSLKILVVEKEGQ